MSTNNRKQMIIDAAVEVLKNHPIEEVTMRRIATTAGLTTGAIYYHYKDKDELLLDIMRYSLHFTPKLYEESLTKNKHKGPELLGEINNEVANRLRKVEHQKLHIKFFSDMIKQKSSITGEYKTHYENMIKYTSELISKSFVLDSSKNDKAVASILMAAVDGIAMQQSLNVLPEDLDRTIEVFISFFNEAIPSFIENHR